MSHTPGPWYASVFLVSDKPGYYDHGRWSIVQTGCHDIREPDECIANARLIAASPELLEALSELAWHVEHDMGTTADNPYLIAAKAAIKKATG